MKMIMIFTALACAAFAQEETAGARDARVAEYNNNATKAAEDRRAFRGTPLHPDAEHAKTSVIRAMQYGITALDAVPQATQSDDKLIWAADDIIFTGVAPGNSGILTRLGVFAYNPNGGFNVVAPVGDSRNTVFVSGDGYDGALFRMVDPGNVGTATEINSFDGIKAFDVLLAVSPNEVWGNTAYGFRINKVGFSGKSLTLPQSSDLSYLGRGSIGYAVSPKGDIASIDVTGQIIWVQRKGSQYPDILYGYRIRAVAIAYDSTGKLYVLVAGRNPSPGDNNPYEPSRIITLTDNGQGKQPTVTEMVSGQFDTKYGPNSIMISGGKLYFTANMMEGKALLAIDANDPKGGVQIKIPPSLLRGATSVALMNVQTTALSMQQ